MSSTSPRVAGPAPDSPADVRPLPARPNLEFERKQAKRLLSQIHEADPEALARVSAKLRESVAKKPDEFQLADAQFTIAREYGFTSWPKLVEYFETLVMHEASGQRRRESHERLDSLPRQLLRQHAARLPVAASTLARFIPRFYGRSAAEIFASVVTEDEARLAAARMHRYPSWQAMLETPPLERDRWRDESPMRHAFRAMREKNLGALKAILASHPELQDVPNPSEPWATSVIYNALHSELRTGPGTKSLELSEWLASTDLDLTPALNWLLLGYMRIQTRDVQWMLDQGADPNWVAPNGFSVLEHALYRYWNGTAVDLFAHRVKRPKGLWVAAGVGDLDAVERYFDKQGRLTEAAREHRPDYTAMGPLPAPPAFGDEDVDILWDAFLIATWNERLPVMEFLLKRGLPIDYAPWGQRLIEWAIFEGRPSLVEFFISHGSQIDLRLRGHVEEHFAQHPDEPRRRILELCGGRDADIVRSEYEQRRSQRVMQTAPQIEQTFVFAKQDAVHAGATAVSPENLFVGLLREDGLPVSMLAVGGVDLPKLRMSLGERFELRAEPPADMTADPACTEILIAARSEAEQRRHGVLTTQHVFKTLLERAPQSVIDLIQSSGGNVTKIRTETERTMSQMG